MACYWEDRPARGRISNFLPSKLQLKGVTNFLLFEFTKENVQWKMVWLPSLPPCASPLPFSWFLNVFTTFSSSQSLYDFIISPSIAHLCPLKSGQSDFLETCFLDTWIYFTPTKVSLSLFHPYMYALLMVFTQAPIISQSLPWYPWPWPCWSVMFLILNVSRV